MGHPLAAIGTALALWFGGSNAPEPGWLGVRLAPLPGLPEAPKEGPKVAITLVFPGSGAEKAGARKGDQVLRLDGVEVASVDGMIDVVRRHAVGQSLEIAVLRDGARHVLTATLGTRPDPQAYLREQWVTRPFPAEVPLVDVRTGKPARVRDLAGSPLLVDIWATTCGPCVAMLPDLGGMAERHAGDGLRVVSLSDEDLPVLTAFATEHPKVAHTLWADPGGELSAALWISVLPTLILVDQKGVIRRVAFGRQTPAELEALVAPLLRAEAP
jgi:thiol-disulfide isomerase/thioredoxin